MESKEAIMAAATALIQEKGDRLDEITVREICKRSGVGLGLVNYHFGNKDHLIEVCVERIVNGIIQRFLEIQQQTEGLSPRERLERLGAMTLDFLFEHEAVSRISILSDLNAPRRGTIPAGPTRPISLLWRRVDQTGTKRLSGGGPCALSRSCSRSFFAMK